MDTRSIWHPWQQMRRMQREMEDLFGNLPAAWRWPLTAEYPPVNIARADSSLTVEALCPGAERNSFDITVVGDTVTIRCERKPPDCTDRALSPPRTAGRDIHPQHFSGRAIRSRSNPGHLHQRDPPGCPQPRSRGRAQEDRNPRLRDPGGRDGDDNNNDRHQHHDGPSSSRNGRPSRANDGAARGYL